MDQRDPIQDTGGDAIPGACPRCHKPAPLCVCAALRPVENRVFVLILQHPQEQDRELGTARLTELQLANVKRVVGLSWPSLAAILGRRIEPRRWGVLYLGAAPSDDGGRQPPLRAVDASGAALADQDAVLTGIEGIVLLDGSWSQAKALWWRNPWLLKLRRLVLAPPRRSLYGHLRREPRPDSVATIEAAAFALAALEGDAELPPRVLAPFALLLERWQAGRPAAASRPDRRRRRR